MVMATTTANSGNDSSDENTKAPEKFHISSDDICDVAGGGGNIARTRDENALHADAGAAGAHTKAPRCPLCIISCRKFYCRDCVKNGNIVHSVYTHGEKSFSEKQQSFVACQAKLKDTSIKYEKLMVQQKNTENILFEIKRKKEKLKLLQELILDKTMTLQTLSEERDKLRKANADNRKKLPNYPITVKGLGDYVLDSHENINKLRHRQCDLQTHLQQVTRRGIQQLIEYIFPISEIVLKDEMHQRSAAALTRRNAETAVVGEDETIAALAEAKNTSYIRGKWVFHGSGISEMQYRIVAPSLPANGDYSAYKDWLSDNKDDVPRAAANDVSPSRVSAFRIVGALTYTTQLTQLMSYYLNVRLPQKLAYGDFCRKLNEEQFDRKVSRLNSNIMYLAYTQQVKLSKLNENHTLENVLAILDLERSDLGRHGYHEVNNARLMKSIDSLLIVIETATESESEDDNSLRLDWEAVPSISTQPEIFNPNLTTPAPQQQSTIGEGLITSAANRITSILRWIK